MASKPTLLLAAASAVLLFALGELLRSPTPAAPPRKLSLADCPCVFRWEASVGPVPAASSSETVAAASGRYRIEARSVPKAFAKLFGAPELSRRSSGSLSARGPRVDAYEDRRRSGSALDSASWSFVSGAWAGQFSDGRSAPAAPKGSETLSSADSLSVAYRYFLGAPLVADEPILFIGRDRPVAARLRSSRVSGSVWIERSDEAGLHPLSFQLDSEWIPRLVRSSLPDGPVKAVLVRVVDKGGVEWEPGSDGSLAPVAP